MAKNREAVTCNGRAAFYAAMWDDIRQCAMDCGWAVALHGSLSADMDIMAMPWVADAVSFTELVKRIKLLFTGNHIPGLVITYNEKPHGRIVATIPIWADFYLDISTMEGYEVVLCKECKHFKPGDDGILYCKRDKLKPGKFMKNFDFCSYGERKDNDTATDKTKSV